MLSARSASQDFITSTCHFICLSVRDEMKNSTAVEVASIPSSENYLDRDFLNDIQKRSKKSNRFITCQACGKTITRSSMVKHQISFHQFQKIDLGV